MNVEFYFDPSCPWCWITSRWLTEVMKQRDLKVTWRSFSLALKNGELGGDNTSGHAGVHVPSHQLLRVIEAVREGEGDDKVGTLYTSMGKRWHVEGNKSAEIIKPALAEAGLPESYAAAADDAKWDEALQKSLDSAIAVVGNDVGVPTIIFATSTGKHGFFGPVISELPSEAEGLKLWDGLAAMSAFPNFYELKRTRTSPPDVASTAKALH